MSAGTVEPDAPGGDRPRPHRRAGRHPAPRATARAPSAPARPGRAAAAQPGRAARPDGAARPARRGGPTPTPHAGSPAPGRPSRARTSAGPAPPQLNPPDGARRPHPSAGSVPTRCSEHSTVDGAGEKRCRTTLAESMTRAQTLHSAAPEARDMDTTPRPRSAPSTLRSNLRRGLGAAGAAVAVAFVGTAALGAGQAHAAGVDRWPDPRARRRRAGAAPGTHTTRRTRPTCPPRRRPRTATRSATVSSSRADAGRVSDSGRARRARAARPTAPSPLAAATRFIEPARMSPAAKTPGTVVSRLSGGSPPARLPRHVATRQHEAPRVARDRVGQPVAVRRRTDEQEEAPAVAPLSVPSACRARDPAEPAVVAGTALDDLGAPPDLIRGL